MKLTRIVPIGLVCSSLIVTGCGSNQSSSDSTDQATLPADSVSVENCGETVQYPNPTTKLFANDGNIISIALAAGAIDDLVAVSSLERDRDVIALKYGDGVNNLTTVNAKYPSLENVVAADPEVVFAGWNYGFKDGDGLNPDNLAAHGIGSYILSESCRQEGTTKRGTMDPWEALSTDITNIGTITGHADEAKKSVDEIDARRQALEAAPRADRQPVGFLFDSASETIFSSGSFGAPQAMMETAGVTNALSDVEDTWTSISWERLTATDPDIIFFVDYPPQTLEEKIEALETNPASKDLTAVKEKRYVNLPYAMWTSGPLNIDGAEYIRAALEHYGLQPASDITPALDITKLTDLPGNEWLTE